MVLHLLVQKTAWHRSDSGSVAEFVAEFVVASVVAAIVVAVEVIAVVASCIFAALIVAVVDAGLAMELGLLAEVAMVDLAVFAKV